MLPAASGASRTRTRQSSVPDPDGRENGPKHWRLIVGLFVCLLWTTDAAAQATAQISGSVRDQSGAVLPGVTVTATQTDTGIVRTTVTNEVARTCCRICPSARTDWKPRCQGSGRMRRPASCCRSTALPLSTSSSSLANLPRPSQVEASAPLVETREVGISQVIENERILELPLNGRQRHRADHAGRRSGAVGNGPLQHRRRRSAAGVGGRRCWLRHGLHAGRRQPCQLHQRRRHAGAVPRRGAGVQRRNQRPVGIERQGQRREHGDQVGHQRVSRQRVRVPARRRVQRAPVLRHGRTARSSAISSAARSAAPC